MSMALTESKDFIVRKTVFATLLFCAIAAHASDDDDEQRPVFGAHPGYLFDVSEEKNRREVEMVMLEPPKSPKKPLSKVIFDEKLSKEFQDQYRYRFGETQAEQVTNNPGRDSEYTYYNTHNVTVQDYQKFQRQFGDYMLRRLGEYHLDNYMKSDPGMKPVYAMKERLSNQDVKMRGSWKIKWKYNISGPSMEATLENPYKVETRVQVFMTGLITVPRDVIYTTGYQLTPKYKVQALYRSAENLYQLVGTRVITKHLSTSVTASEGQLPDVPTIYQKLLLFGVSWSE